MLRSKQHSPHFTFADECDVTNLVKLRDEAKGLAEERGVKLTYLPFVIKALVAAFRRFPTVNAVVDDVYTANQEVAFAIEDATTRHGAQLAALSSQQTDLIARIIRELLLAAAGGEAPDGLNDPTEIGNVTTLLDSLRANEAQLRARGRGPYRPLVDTLLTSDEVTVFPGIVQRALGIPTSMFTCIFSLARTVGWMTQWEEMLTDPEYKIGRPRQLYIGQARRDVPSVR